MRVKHFRLEKDDTRYLLALIPINFGKLAEDRTVESGIATDGFYMLAIDDDAHVEADPYSWIAKDWDLVYAHFYLREKAKELRGGQILRTHEIRAEVEELVQKLAMSRNAGARISGDQSSVECAAAERTPISITPPSPRKQEVES